MPEAAIMSVERDARRATGREGQEPGAESSRRTLGAARRIGHGWVIES